MAEAICGGASYAIKSNSISVPSIVSLTDGIVVHPALSIDDQIRILSTVDQGGGGSTIGDCMASLPDHPAPAAAVLALVAAGVLMLEKAGAIDVHTRVFRPSLPRPDDDEDSTPPAGAAFDPLAVAPADDPLPGGLEALPTMGFAAAVYLLDGARRGLARDAMQLQKPGIYIAWWPGQSRAYVGMSECVGKRVANGPHLADPLARIAIVVDESGVLTSAQAAVGERILHGLVTHAGGFDTLNEVPTGAPVRQAEYERLRLFVTEAALALRQAGALFGGRSPQQLFAGPRTLADTPVVAVIDEAALVHELEGVGVMARAVEQTDGWVLLKHSTVRRDVVATAGAPASMRRAELVCSGLLRDLGYAYELVTNIRFQSGSAAAQFVVGSKGRGVAGWVPLSIPDPARLTH